MVNQLKQGPLWHMKFSNKQRFQTTTYNVFSPCLIPKSLTEPGAMFRLGERGFVLGDCISSQESPRRRRLLIPFHPDFFVAPRSTTPDHFRSLSLHPPPILKWHKNTELGVNQSNVMGFRSLATKIKSRDRVSGSISLIDSLPQTHQMT